MKHPQDPSNTPPPNWRIRRPPKRCRSGLYYINP